MPSEKPTSGPPPAESPAIQKAAEIIRDTETERSRKQLREELQSLTMDQLDQLARQIQPEEQEQVSDEERQIIFERVEELRRETDIDRALVFLERHASLATLIARQLEASKPPSLLDKAGSGFMKILDKARRKSGPIGTAAYTAYEFISRQASTAGSAIANLAKKGFYYLMSTPAAMGAFVGISPSNPLLGPLLEKSQQFGIENLAKLNVLPAITKAVERERQAAAQNAVVFSETEVNERVFIVLMEKVQSGDNAARGNKVPAAITSLVQSTVREVIANRRQADPTVGTPENPIEITQADLEDPQAEVKRREEAAQQAQLAAIRTTWGESLVKTVEFGDQPSYDRAAGKLTVPEAAVDKDGAPTSAAAEYLQTAMSTLNNAQEITVVTEPNKLEIRKGGAVTLSAGMPLDGLSELVTFTKDRVSVLRGVQNDAIPSGQRVQFLIEGGTGVLQWNLSNVATTDISEAVSAIDTSAAVSGDQWEKKAGAWELVART